MRPGVSFPEFPSSLRMGAAVSTLRHFEIKTWRNAELADSVPDDEQPGYMRRLDLHLSRPCETDIEL